MWADLRAGVGASSCHMVSHGAEPQFCHMVSGGGASVMSHGQSRGGASVVSHGQRGRSLSHVTRSNTSGDAGDAVVMGLRPLQCEAAAAAAALTPPTPCFHPLEDGGLVKVLWAEPEAELLMLSAAPPPSFMTPPSSARPPHPHITVGCTPVPPVGGGTLLSLAPPAGAAAHSPRCTGSPRRSWPRRAPPSRPGWPPPSAPPGSG